MGDQSTLKLHYTLIMKAFIFATLLALATASPIEDTPEVAAAKAEFQKAFDAAVAGEHAGLMVTDGRTIITDGRVQGPTAYLADLPEVAEAKAAFKAAFDAAAAGEHIALAPKPVEALPVAPIAPVVAAHGHYPYAAYHAAYPYAHAAYPYAHGAYPYAHAGYPYNLGYHGYPYVTVAKSA